MEPQLILAPKCESLYLKSIPSPLYSNTSGVILVESNPPGWRGNIKVSASNGSFNDSEQEGSYIVSAERLFNYSGGQNGTIITVQAEDSSMTKCFGTIQIKEKITVPCEKIMASSKPSPLPENQSAEILIITEPDYWTGTFLIKSDSGKLQLTGGDNSSVGDNTNILITRLKKLIYTGGKAGETLEIQALGETNKACNTILKITE